MIGIRRRRRERIAAELAAQMRLVRSQGAYLVGLQLRAELARHVVSVQECPRRHCVPETQWIPVCTICGPIRSSDACTMFREVAERETSESHRAELAGAFVNAVTAISPTTKAES